MESFVEDAIPDIKTSLIMSADIASIAARTPEILTAQNDEERAATVSEIDISIRKLEDQVRSLDSLEEAEKTRKLALIAAFQSGIVDVGENVRKKEAIEDRIAIKVADMLSAHEDFLVELPPLLDNANFNLVITSEDTINSSAALTKELLEGEVSYLRAGLGVSASLRQLFT